VLQACKNRHFAQHVQYRSGLGTGAAAAAGTEESSSLDSIVGLRANGAHAGQIGYTVEMNSEAIERIETKIAFLESANVELSDVVYRQQQEIAALRARLDALTQRIEAAQTPETPRSPEEERPPHY
jgi:SlyX protein